MINTIRKTFEPVRDLYGWDKARKMAVENFKANRKFMHSTTAGLVAKEIHIE